jgi:Carbohydrate esterase, sialic acid-specific acetylesterase
LEGESVKEIAAKVRGLLVGLAVSTLMLAGVAPVQAAERVTVLHVFVAVGQSNMSGRGLPRGSTDDPTDPRIFQYGSKVRTFRSATVPLDMHDTPSGISPATTFAREYLKTQPTNVGVLIIPAAHGATAFTSAASTLTWSVGAASAPEFDLPSRAVALTRQGLAAAKAAGYTAGLKGILWHQGEGNSWMTTSAYSAKLDQLIAHFRSRLSAPRLPFVVGGLAPEGIATRPGSSNVDTSHKQTPERVAYTGFAPAMAGGVNPGDAVHFSRTGVEHLGKTYLTGYQRAVSTSSGQASSIAPTRFLDTRSSSGRVAGGGSVSFQVAGRHGIPTGVAAVAVNVTVTEPTSFGFITAHASGTAKPNASNVNYAKGQTVPNLAIVPVGSDGKVTLSNTSSGSAHLIADISTYFRSGTPASPGTLKSLSPSRFLDTRSSSGPVAGGGSVSFQVGGVRGIPANVSAIVVNVTATETRSFGFLTAHASGSAVPQASNVNYEAGQTVPNLVVVPVGRDGKVTISNASSGSAQIIADVSGYFRPGVATKAGTFAALTPTRLLDTRRSSGPLRPGGSVAIQIGGVRGIPANVAAVVVNLTVAETKSFGFLTAFASGLSTPNVSNVNYARGQTVPNLAVVPVGPDGRVRITNTSSGTVQLIADVSGYILD